MKNFKLFKLLLLGVVLITSIPQVRAWTFDYPYIWFCNTSATDWGSNVMFFYYYHGSDEGSEGFNMKNASHTKLWYVHVEHNRGTSLSGFKYGFIATKDWGYNSGDTWSSRWTYACSNFNHSGDSQTNLDCATFLCTSSGSDNLSVSRLAAGESWASLNKSQTVKKYTRGDGAGSYTAASVASGTVTISAYKITGAGTASNSGNSATISAAATTSASRDAAYTGEVTVTATANTGYVFMGWYGSENGTDKLSSNSSYTYNAPNSAKTVYARFAEKLTVGKTLYLATNAKWRENSAKFEAVFCNATTQQWVNCTAVAGTDDMYSVNVPSGDWGCVIFVRMNPSGTAHDWSGKWCQTDDMYKSGLNNCVYITGDCSNSDRWGKYAPQPAIVGSMNNWDPVANQFTDGQLVLNTLSANRGYQFKVAVGRDDYWYGYGGSNNTQTYVGQTTAITLTAGNNDMAIATAGTGNYTFKWNSSDHTLKVEFPSVEHPSTDYVYVKPYSDWDPVNAHLYGGIYGTVWTYDPALSTVTIYGNDYYYTSLGDHDKIIFGSGVTNDHRTKSLGESPNESDAPTSHKGRFYDASGAYAGWAWADFTATLSLDHQAATNTPAPNNITVSFNKTTNLTGDVLTTDPEKNGYSFGGYYTEQGGSGSQFINASGNVQNVSGYTSSGKWIRTGSEATTTVYAKWTQSVTLNKHNETSDGNVTMTYNSNSHPTITAPTKDHYTFAGWYTAESGGTMVMNTSGVLQNSATYTDASGKWTNSGAAPTLHAQWTEIPYTVTVNIAAGGGGSTNVSSVTDAKIVTGSSTITATPANAAWRFKEWQLGDGVTIKTGSTTSASITVNATQNSSVTAVFEPRFALMGSRNTKGGETEGMPGWTPKDALPSFTVNSVGEPDGSGNMTADLTCTRTLLPNRSYKFEIYDRESKVLRSTSASEAQVTLAANASVQLTSTWNEVGDNTNKDVLINATGYGEYTFKITAISNDGYPTITVLRPTVYQNHMGWKYADKESNLHDGNVGGKVTAVATEGGNEYDIADGGFVSQGSSITYTAHPATGYNFNGWYNNSDCNTGKFNSNLSWTNSAITAASNSYAQFVPKTYTITLNGNEATTAGTTSVTATYNSNVLSASIAAPKKTGNVFAGWYSGVGGTGDQVIDATGALRANVDGYTGAEGIWTKDATPVTLYAKWIAIADLNCWDNEGNYLCGYIAGFATPKLGATNWNTASNWPNNTAPTIETSVVLTSNMTVDADHAKAKEIVLKDGVKLTINPNMGLEVAGTITKADGSAPTASDLVLGSSASGNATLIFNNSNSAAATIGMYSKASVVGSTWNWQYMASPYVSASALHNYYGSYLYRWGNGDGTTTGWFAVPNGGSVVPFVAYCITNKTAGTYYQMEGTMVETDGNNQSISVPAGKSWVVGNSWTAPIQIGQLQDDDFEGLLKNVYLYNTGMDEDRAASMVANPEGEARYAANTYVSIPIHSASYFDISVVSSLQGFYVKDDPSVAGGGTLKLNYTNHVRPSGEKSIQNGAMHAPKRIMAEDNEPNVLKIKVCGSKYDDRLVLLERADFSMGYDAGWDGDKMGNVAASPRITVEREDGTSDAVSAVPDLEGLAINFRAANTDNQQTLYFEYSDDIDPLYIVDVTNNEYTRVLTGNSYTFSTSDNEEHPRFILTRYGAPAITTGVDEVYNANSARKQMINGTLYIIRDGRIYNAEGALVK